jgi:hypothetical protein
MSNARPESVTRWQPFAFFLKLRVYSGRGSDVEQRYGFSQLHCPRRAFAGSGAGRRHRGRHLERQRSRSRRPGQQLAGDRGSGRPAHGEAWNSDFAAPVLSAARGLHAPLVPDPPTPRGRSPRRLSGTLRTYRSVPHHALTRCQSPTSSGRELHQRRRSGQGASPSLQNGRLASRSASARLMPMSFNMWSLRASSARLWRASSCQCSRRPSPIAARRRAPLGREASR